jgi:peptidyl-prolyl cis-trans isomerase SurA
MMKFSLKLLSLSVLTFATLYYGPASSQSGPALDRVIAVVNSEAITSRELALRVAVVTRQLRKQNVELPPADILEKQVLDRLIINSAQAQLARSLGVGVDEASLDRAVAGIADQNKLSISALKDRVERDGISWPQFREDIRQEIISSRLREREVDSRVFISESDIDAFMLEQEGADLSQKEYNVAQILLKLPANPTAEQITAQRLRGEEILKQASRGIEFTRLAASFSDGLAYG